MKFLMFVIFKETFLEKSLSQYEYANEWVDDVIVSQISMYFIYKFWQFSTTKIAQTCKNMSPYHNISEQNLFCIYSEWT